MLVSAMAAPAASNTVPTEVSSANGGFRTDVAFDLPSFHGLEPKLGVAYDASRANGVVGVGWTLTGQSRIVARPPKGGVPRYDGSDSYSLDGTLLHPCSGARCLGTGGTHVGETHRFERIARDTVSDAWFVTSGDGTVREYRPTVTTPRGTFSWDLRRVRDRNGNVVDYNYVVDQQTAYLDTISYGDVVVTLVREERFEPAGGAVVQTGAATLGKVRYRLQHVRVAVSGAQRALWSLNYSISLGPWDSRLSSIDSCGRDAAVYPTAYGGHLVTGTCLPPTRFTYEGGSGMAAFTPVSSSQASDYRGFTPATGDFNGDGNADLVWTKASSTGFDVRTMLATGAGKFAAPVATVPLTGDFSTYEVRVADLDGDGRSDLVLSALGSTGWMVRSLIASGAGGFTTGASYLPMPSCTGCPTDYTGFALTIADGDTDGTQDLFATRLAASGMTRIRALSARDTWSLAPPAVIASDTSDYTGKRVLAGDFRASGSNAGVYIYPHAANRTYLAADINGDGGDDVIDIPLAVSGSTTYASNIAYNSTAGVDGPGNEVWQRFTVSGYAGGQYTTGGVVAADLNGDGYADLIFYDIPGRKLYVNITTTGTTGLPTYFNSATVLASAPMVADFDGDGRLDIATYAAGSTTLSLRVALGTMAPPARLSQVTTAAGKVTSVTYASSADFANTYLPVGFTIPVVKTLTVSDGRGTSSTSSYDYAGGLWSDADREFLGFSITSKTDGAGTKTETSYRQTRASAGAAELVTISDATGLIYSQVERSFLEKDDAWPRYSLIDGETSYACNRDATGAGCKMAQTETTWNVTYGVATRVDRYGDLAVAGDESTTTTSYVANASAFIGTRPSVISTYAGIGTAGTLLARTTHAYDGRAAGAAPIRGNVTASDAWHDGTGYTVARTRRTYNPAGDLIAVVDPLGRTTTVSYDSMGRPIATCNALAHCTTRVWDATLGVVLSNTDANAMTTHFTYDALGRPLRTTFPSGGWSEVSYVATGNPVAQYTQVKLSDGSADGLWIRSYRDGLDRVYQVDREGGARQLTDYSATHPTRITRQSTWRLASASPIYTTFAYDGLGRVISRTSPEGKVTTTTYASNEHVTVDPRGGKHAEVVDALGRQVKLRELVGGVWHTTTTAYDALGRPVRIIDAAGNATTRVFDSLGRVVQSCDPDRGCRVYSFDAVGNLVGQT
ncbi:MAG: toxin TcdB middle/N-terminal domain-containing protein, partial [Kofleriaceae bacterium]